MNLKNILEEEQVSNMRILDTLGCITSKKHSVLATCNFEGNHCMGQCLSQTCLGLLTEQILFWEYLFPRFCAVQDIWKPAEEG
jgi:hypothetical protein